MNGLKSFFKTSLLGGLIVILPVALLLFLMTWVFDLVTGLIAPLTDLLLSRSHMGRILADLIVIGVVLLSCFLVGIFVRTKLGALAYGAIERGMLNRAPGYSLIKETVLQFLGNKRSPFSSVALARIFGNDTLVSSFITDRHADGSYTIFVPTGPNPTSGNIYHLKGKYVHPVDVSIEDAMRSIISCGAGSTKLVEARNGGRRGKKL
jgi:uncharacterized membrane protein